MTATEPPCNPKSVTKPACFSPYLPLSQNVDSIRVIKIQPATHNTELLACELIPVAFRDRPKFEALSYMWGDERVKETILLNGTKFKVGRNLWDALHYLRHRGDGTLYWIDAISINQRDIPERNKQVRVMYHIYFRATTVVIWLGKKYEKYQSNMNFSDLQSQDSSLKTTDRIGSSGLVGNDPSLVNYKCKNEEREMVKDLMKNEYWHRVWIIQEIGRAREMQVCFGNLDLAWDRFIALITRHSSGEERPLRLAQQLERKYVNAHTLRQLLFDHRDALCKDRKDKIYGLIGLAVDARGFPVDYSKSLSEIWMDTMRWMDKRELFQKPHYKRDIIKCGLLIKFLLTGAETRPLKQISGPLEGQLETIFVPGNPNMTKPLKKNDPLVHSVSNSREQNLARFRLNQANFVTWTSKSTATKEQIENRNSGLYGTKQGNTPTTQGSRNWALLESPSLYQFYIHQDSLPWGKGIQSDQARPADPWLLD
ncbi:Fc.00g078360.m01.CDS01 [Cosmosporella sp. VM-42]